MYPTIIHSKSFHISFQAWVFFIFLLSEFCTFFKVLPFHSGCNSECLLLLLFPPCLAVRKLHFSPFFPSSLSSFFPSAARPPISIPLVLGACFSWHIPYMYSTSTYQHTYIRACRSKHTFGTSTVQEMFGGTNVLKKTVTFFKCITVGSLVANMYCWLYRCIL